MNTFEDFLYELNKSISQYGYIRPSSEALFVNEKFYLFISYDPRESVNIRFGVHKNNCHPQLIRESDIKNIYSSNIFGNHLEDLKIDSTSFNNACGGYINNNLQVPNFNILIKIISSTIDMLQQSFTRPVRND